jgi:hypothetical protein
MQLMSDIDGRANGQHDSSDQENAIAAAQKLYGQNTKSRLPVIGDSISFAVGMIFAFDLAGNQGRLLAAVRYFEHAVLRGAGY